MVTREPIPTSDRRARTAAGALAVDVAGVLIFIALGRRNHDEGVSLAGVAETAWPFVTGTLVGWLVSRGWRRPTALAPTGVVVWVCTVAVGMALRKATSAGIAVSFIVVATLVTALLLLGWRAGLAALTRRRSGTPNR
jgi:peptidoglycan/LPS O-acetylase OafA/YrhL